MASILKVDQIQLPDGSAPTASDLGVDVSGNVLQCVTAKTNTQTSMSGDNTWRDSGLSVSITPTASNSKFLVQVSAGSLYRGAAAMQWTFGMQRNSTWLSQSLGQTYNNSGVDQQTPYIVMEDIPNTSSTVTYSFWLLASGGSSGLFCSNGQSSTITVWEIAQ